MLRVRADLKSSSYIRGKNFSVKPKSQTVTPIK